MLYYKPVLDLNAQFQRDLRCVWYAHARRWCALGIPGPYQDRLFYVIVKNIFWINCHTKNGGNVNEIHSFFLPLLFSSFNDFTNTEHIRFIFFLQIVFFLKKIIFDCVFIKYVLPYYLSTTISYNKYHADSSLQIFKGCWNVIWTHKKVNRLYMYLWLTGHRTRLTCALYSHMQSHA